MSVLQHQDLTPAELDELLSAVLPEIPGYRVVRLLGRGGMSYVYLGIQESLDRQVAIKVISPLALEDEVGMHRFEREARTIAKLQHPSIVGIHAVGRMDMGLLYYVMPYLSHGHLGRRDLRCDQPRVIGILRALLGALDYAHAQGVVHRDVKAENVLFDQNDRAMLTDFGIAITKRDRARMTGAGNAVGSWGYMAPEQARGEHVDARADIYSVGVLTFEMLTGKLPFQNADTVALALMHAMDPIPRLPPDKAHWQAFIDRSMAKRPEHRFASAREMLHALDAIALERSAMQPARPAARGLRGSLDALHRSLGRLKSLVLRPESARAADEASSAARGAWKPRPVVFAAGSLMLLALVLLAGVWWSAGKDEAAEPARADGAPLAVAADPAPAPPVAVAADAVPPSDAASASTEVDSDAADNPEAPGEQGAQALLEEEAEPGLAEEVEAALLALPPGEAALMTAAEQIRRKRLTQPRGDSALDSLLAARRLLGADPRVKPAAERWVAAVQPYFSAALERHDDAGALAFLASLKRLEEGLDLGALKGADALRQSPSDAVRADLRHALAEKNLVALKAARERAVRLGVPSASLEPEYSQPIVTAKVGDVLRGGVATVIVRMPSQTEPGLAVMPTPVTQGEYAAYANATGRPAAQCRIRTAVITVKARTWKAPGFAQSPDHPVVCLAEADAQAYAAWIGQRDGVRYRIPTQAEWRLATGAPATAACGAGGVRCRTEGTAPASAGAKTRAGVHSTLGNVREWTRDCAGCREHPTLGLGWRDAEPSRKGDKVNPEFGYDDLGFRLVREVPLEAVQQR